MNKKKSGQGMTEYLIIVALIAVSAIAIMKTTSSSMKVGFGKIANALQGREASGGRAEQVTNNKVKGRTMEDFNEGVAGSDN